MVKLAYKTILFILALFLCLGASSRYVIAEEVLTWDDCVKEALKNHPELIYAQESLIQSRADKNISTANILPQI